MEHLTNGHLPVPVLDNAQLSDSVRLPGPFASRCACRVTCLCSLQVAAAPVAILIGSKLIVGGVLHSPKASQATLAGGPAGSDVRALKNQQRVASNARSEYL